MTRRVVRSKGYKRFRAGGSWAVWGLILWAVIWAAFFN